MYLPTFCESQLLDFYPGSSRIFAGDLNISKDIQRVSEEVLKILKDYLNVWSQSLIMCFAY